MHRNTITARFISEDILRAVSSEIARAFEFKRPVWGQLDIPTRYKAFRPRPQTYSYNPQGLLRSDTSLYGPKVWMDQ